MNTFDCVIIGAGLAGSYAAYYLSLSGRKCLVIDSGTIASGASGNMLGGVMPYITHPSYVGHSLYEDGFALSASLVKAWKEELPSAYFSSAAQFPSNERPKKLFDAPGMTVLNPQEAADFIGCTPSTAVLVYENSIVLNPGELCRLLLKKSGCQVIQDSSVQTFKRTSDAMEVIADDGMFSCANVVICNAFNSIDFPESSFLPVKKVRGQVVWLSPNDTLKKIKVPLCYNGYYLPSEGAKALLGTTYDYTFLSPLPCPERNEKMLQTLQKWIPECGNDAQQLSLEDTRVSFRTVSKDRLPIAGRLASNVYISTAHGSRGLHSAGICAQYIAALMDGKPFKDSLAQAIDPMRKTLRSTA